MTKRRHKTSSPAETTRDEQAPQPEQADQQPSPPPHAEEKSPEQKLEELETKYRRAMADLANAHKRFQKERERTAALAVAGFVRKLLPMIDNLSHSLKSARDTHDPAALIHGFRLVEAQLLQILSDNDIRPIETVGKPFDPEIHHAVTTDATDQVPPGTVTEELGRGFMMGDFVVRPAQVKVAAAPRKAETDNEPKQEEQES